MKGMHPGNALAFLLSDEDEMRIIYHPSSSSSQGVTRMSARYTYIHACIHIYIFHVLCARTKALLYVPETLPMGKGRRCRDRDKERNVEYMVKLMRLVLFCQEMRINVERRI